jgi:hypothetical protein
MPSFTTQEWMQRGKTNPMDAIWLTGACFNVRFTKTNLFTIPGPGGTKAEQSLKSSWHEFCTFGVLTVTANPTNAVVDIRSR